MRNWLLNLLYLFILTASINAMAYDYLLSNNNNGTFYQDTHLPETVGVTYIYDTSAGGLDLLASGQDEADSGDNTTREPDMIDGSGSSGGDAVWGPWDGNKRVDVVFDLGQEFYVSKFDLRTMGTAGSNGVSEFTVYVSSSTNSISNSGGWTAVGVNSSISYGNAANLITVANNTKARYVWFSIQGADQQLQLSELAIFGNLNDPPDCGTSGGSANQMFGVASHMIHTDIFNAYPNGYWRPEITLPWVTGAGLKWVREPIYLSDLFDSAGNINSRRAELIERYLQMYQNANVSVVLDPLFSLPIGTALQNAFNYIAQLSITYPCIKAIELHNEPNLPWFWTAGVSAYVDYCNAAYGYIKAINPYIPVVGGSFAGWGYVWDDVNALASCGWYDGKVYPDSSVDWEGVNTKWLKDALAAGLLNYCDAISFHPYRDQFPPEGGKHWEAGNDPSGFEKETDSVWNIVQQYNAQLSSPKDIKFYYTEIGYSSASTAEDYRGTETVQKQADYLTRLMAIIMHKRLGGISIRMVSWYDLKCDDPNVGAFEQNFGLLSNDATTARPGYYYYSRFAAYFNNIDDFKLGTASVSFTSYPSYMKAFSWRKNNGEYVIPFWRLNQLQATDTDFSTTLQVNNLGGNVTSVQLYSSDSDTPVAKSFTQNGTTVSIPVTARRYAQWLVIKVRPSLLSGNTCGYVIPAGYPTLATGATYRWISEASGDVFGASDPNLVATDDGNDMTDGISEESGGDYAVHGTWNGSGVYTVATCEFDLKKDYILTNFTLSLLWDAYRHLTALEVYTSRDALTWELWAQWDQTSPADNRDARIDLAGAPTQTRYVRIFTRKGAYQQVLGEMALFGFEAPQQYLLSNNTLGYMFAADCPKIATGATYNWVTERNTAEVGATDPYLASTDDGNDMTDGVSEGSGGDYAVHGTWDGSGVNAVATCEFDLKKEYYITEVMLSQRWDEYRALSVFEVHWQDESGSWHLWQQWNGSAPASSRDARISLYGVPVKCRKVRIFTQKSLYQQILGEIAIFGQKAN